MSITSTCVVFLSILDILVYAVDNNRPLDCGDIDIKRGSGVYKIYPEGSGQAGFNVYCDMDSENVDGGWTVFQRRLNGEEYFFRGWRDYKEGFGTLQGEHWLGNAKLHILTSQTKVNVEDRLQLFKVYLKEELQHETPDEDGKPIVCLSCYKAFNKYTKSDEQEKSRFKTDMYLTDCLSSIEIMECNTRNIDTYCYRNILKYVVSSFLLYKPLLLSKVYNVYASEVDTVKDFNLVVNDDRLRIVQHSATWLFTMLKSSLGPALVLHAAQSKKQGRMIYRLGTNLIQCLHSTISDHHKESDELNNKISALEKKVNSNIASSSSLNTMECLDKTARLMKTHVKLYVQDAIKTQLPDIHCFDLFKEIKKINPTLWNFIYVLTSNEEEEKIWRQSYFSWNKHYMPEDMQQKCRLFPRLYIASCIFHANSSHCVQPLHLLASDILDKYSNSSSDLLTINSRLGAGISKDTLKRFITNRVMQLNRDNTISSESFALASFDNLDKNQSYALVGSGKDKSGFHGTTIQAVIPKPSEKNENLDIASPEHIETIDHRKRIEMSSNRTLPSDIIKSLKEPNNLIGEPSEVKYNKFQALKLVDFHESEVEIHQWNTFQSMLISYGFVKDHVKEKQIIIPGLKTYLSYSQKTTEASTFHSIAVLDDPADSKETVVKTLNILHDRFQIGNKLQYLVVVGDGKSYDHLIKLKAEYWCVLDWFLPYPGDWHILKNILQIFIKIFYDAGLKELAGIYHHGATLKVLTECTKFSVTHRFFCHVWEAMLRCQIDAYKNQETAMDWRKELDIVLNTVLSSCDHTPDTSEKCAGDILDCEMWKSLLQEKSKLESLFDGVCTNFDQWRFHNCTASATFQFWDTFVHTDFMAYLGLYIGIRSRNWNLRNVSLKKLACLFYAFHRHNYLRMIPYHLADRQTFPQSVLDHFEAGCFSVSNTGKKYYCVALDEAHEMEINLKTKQAINSFSPTSLATLTHYLPYRAETLHNIKTQLCIEKSDSQYRETNNPFIETEELTIRQYLSELNTTSLFQENSECPLVHIFKKKKTVATTDQSNSILNYRECGNTDMQKYITCFLIKSTELSAKQMHIGKRMNL
ncbi:unnamed protein product [Mytilus edulis]|uniref:Fibrinogen C-terminal domain-containing protein n=1 Tax=Mytilus edulis TaxID=6550 RepID=A0A8S3RE19_MYTED|nr:unnamed protein product [Mytilus edulis]